MTALLVTVPLMLLGVSVAVLPVLLQIVRDHRGRRAGVPHTRETARREADHWHRVLGHRPPVVAGVVVDRPLGSYDFEDADEGTRRVLALSGAPGRG